MFFIALWFNETFAMSKKYFLQLMQWKLSCGSVYSALQGGSNL